MIKNIELKYKAVFLRLFAGFGFFQFCLHLFYLLSAKDPNLAFAALVAFLHDLLILLLFYFVASFTLKYIPVKLKTAFINIFITGFIVTGMLLSLYPRMLREYLIFPVNIFESDISIAGTLIIDYLGVSALLPQVIAAAIGIILVFFVKKDIDVNPRFKVIFLVVIIFLSVYSLQRPSPQPFMYSVMMQFESIIKNEKRVVQSLSVSKKEDHHLISGVKYPDNEIKDYNHVIMVVLEGVTAIDYEKEFMNIPSGFYANNITNSNYYENYYANNLDSYTSLIAMIAGIHIPYRSYTDAELYDGVNKEPNLVGYFKTKNFKCLFVSTFEYQPFIPSVTFWDDIYLRKDFDITNYISIGSSRMEIATEDKAAIDKIVKYMNENNKSFILHELAYGHSPEWRATTGTTQLIYYNDYLFELSDKLKKEKIFENTLFVIVSDHGDRTKAADMENYRVPLMLVGKNIKEEKEQSFYSHLNLSSIILSALGVINHPDSPDEIFTVGTSEKWTYGIITNKKSFLFINDAKGTIKSQSEGMNAEEVRSRFQNYINEFNFRYVK